MFLIDVKGFILSFGKNFIWWYFEYYFGWGCFYGVVQINNDKGFFLSVLIEEGIYQIIVWDFLLGENL